MQLKIIKALKSDYETNPIKAVKKRVPMGDRIFCRIYEWVTPPGDDKAGHSIRLHALIQGMVAVFKYPS
jgi:hypothetical protein